MTKPKTQAQLDRATDLRLRKVYGISLAEYEYLVEIGKGGCWICGSKPTTRRLHVDHDHGWKKVKIVSAKFGVVWKVWADYNGRGYADEAFRKSVAVRSIKEKLKRASVRGVLCYPHNAGLQKFSDNCDWLWTAGTYISNFQKGSPLTGQKGSE